MKDVRALREGIVDLDIGVLGSKPPEARAHMLFRDAFVGVVRANHPLLAQEGITPQRYAAFDHVAASRRGTFAGPVDDALEALGLERRVAAVVPGFLDVVRLVRSTDLVGLVTRSVLDGAVAAEGGSAAGLRGFWLPVPTPEITVAAMWHPRMDADPAHRWFRTTVISACQGRAREGSASFPGLRDHRSTS